MGLVWYKWVQQLAICDWLKQATCYKNKLQSVYTSMLGYSSLWIGKLLEKTQVIYTGGFKSNSIIQSVAKLG